MCVWLGLQIVVDVLSVGLGQRLVNQFLHDATAHAAGQPLRQSAVDEGYLQSLYAEVQYVGTQWDAVINVNLKSSFNFIHACVPVMMRQRGGSIINMASVVGVHGNAGQANYAASKAGMIALAKSVAQEMGPKGIRANAIAPGFIETAMTAALPDEIREEWKKKIPLRRGGQVEDIANVATFLASDMSSYVSGQVIQVDGGMNM